MKIKKWEAALVLAVMITVFCGMKIDSDVQRLSNKLIRIHVVANSDSDEDQALKLKVRDAILCTIQPLIENASSREEAAEIIEENLSLIEASADRVIKENGYGYSVSAGIKNEYLPTVQYDTFALPAGKYLALRTVIGEGEGHNWWCVIFPSLCTAPILNTENSRLTDSEAAFITGENNGYIVKFKIAEIIGNLKRYIESSGI